MLPVCCLLWLIGTSLGLLHVPARREQALQTDLTNTKARLAKVEKDKRGTRCPVTSVILFNRHILHCSLFSDCVALQGHAFRQHKVYRYQLGAFDVDAGVY